MQCNTDTIDLMVVRSAQFDLSLLMYNLWKNFGLSHVLHIIILIWMRDIFYKILVVKAW